MSLWAEQGETERAIQTQRLQMQQALSMQQQGLNYGLGSLQDIFNRQQTQFGNMYSQDPPKTPTKEKHMFSGFKDYVHKHGDLIWTIFVVAIADHFLLKGALRSRLHEVIDGFLKKIQKASDSQT